MKDHFDQLLHTLRNHPGSMDAPTLHGFLTAVVIGPDEVVEQYWSQLLKKVTPNTASPDEDSALGNAVMASLHQILHEVAVSGYQPRIAGEKNGNGDLKAWCRGFQQGVTLAETEWEALHDEHPDAAHKGLFIAALIEPEIAETLFGTPPQEHNRFVSENAPLLSPTIEAYYQELNADTMEETDEEPLEPCSLEELPHFRKEELTDSSDEQLFTYLKTLDDTVPSEVILECIERDAPMVERIDQYLADDAQWDNEHDFSEESWWTRLHCIMILGGIPGEPAGRALYRALLHMNDTSDDLFWDWLSGYWPALFRNKPGEVHTQLRTLAENSELTWEIRHNALESVLAHAAGNSPEALEHALDWLAGLISEESEDTEFRYMTGCTLLDFPRPRHRRLLEKIADMQSGLSMGAVFLKNDVNRAFDKGKDSPEWGRFENPWEFYDPEQILERQQRWHSESPTLESFDEPARERNGYGWAEYGDGAALTYTREMPKVGRNDPCPCGSGKKYKKCCLH